MPSEPAAPRRRRSIRLPGYDYAGAGWCFVTICTHGRECLFGEIVDGVMRLNDLGEIVHGEWGRIPARFDHVELGEFVVMPNHFHGIVVIIDDGGTADQNDAARFVGAGLAPAHDCESDIGKPIGQPQGLPLRLSDQPDIGQPTLSASLRGAEFVGLPLRESPRRNTLGDIVGAYKSLVANECLKILKSDNKFMGKIRQRNYYEHIIRNEKSYLNITQYIGDNPANWESDTLFIGGMDRT